MDSLGDGFGYIFPNATNSIKAILAAPLNDTAIRVPAAAISGVNVWALKEVAKLGGFEIEFYVFRINQAAWNSGDKIRQARGQNHPRTHPRISVRRTRNGPLRQAQIMFNAGFDCLWSATIVSPDRLPFMRFMLARRPPGYAPDIPPRPLASVHERSEPLTRRFFAPPCSAPPPGLPDVRCGHTTRGPIEMLPRLRCRRMLTPPPPRSPAGYTVVGLGPSLPTTPIIKRLFVWTRARRPPGPHPTSPSPLFHRRGASGPAPLKPHRISPIHSSSPYNPIPQTAALLQRRVGPHLRLPLRRVDHHGLPRSRLRAPPPPLPHPPSLRPAPPVPSETPPTRPRTASHHQQRRIIASP